MVLLVCLNVLLFIKWRSQNEDGFLQPNFEQIHKSDWLIIITRDVFQRLSSLYDKPCKTNEEHNMVYGVKYVSFGVFYSGFKMIRKLDRDIIFQFFMANWTDGCHDPLSYYKDCTRLFKLWKKCSTTLYREVHELVVW